MSGESDRDQSIERVLRRTLRGTTAPASAGCLDAETVAAWTERTLSPNETATVERHLSDCARCQAMLAAFARTEPVQPGMVAWWRHPTLRWALPLGLGTVAAAALIWVELPRVSKTPVATQTIARVETPAVAGAPSAEPQGQGPAPAESMLAKQQKPATRPTAPPQTRQSSRSVSSQAPAREVDAIAPPAPQAAAPTAASAAPPPSAPFPSVQQPAPPPAPAPERSNAAAASDVRGRDIFGQLKVLPSSAVVSEFVGADQGPATRSVAGGGQGRAGAGGGFGRGAAVAESSPRASAPSGQVRWRILATGSVERSTSGGVSWEPIAIDPPAFMTAGDAPASRVCWLVGRAGVVLRSTDGLHFERLNIPEPANLTSVRALDATHATVTTVDGRVFTTVDGGVSWQSP